VYKRQVLGLTLLLFTTLNPGLAGKNNSQLPIMLPMLPGMPEIGPVWI